MKSRVGVIKAVKQANLKVASARLQIRTRLACLFKASRARKAVLYRDRDLAVSFPGRGMNDIDLHKGSPISNFKFEVRLCF